MINKETAYKKISELVERFEEQYTSYKNADYNETLTRRDFIDPFFKALGWDIDNEQGYSEAYREVIHEDKVKIGSATKAPDYSFRIGGGKRLFFVEAKRPSVVVKDDILPAYQVRRYGWNATLSISIVTDFEEFAVYDCTKKPLPADKASVARVKYLTFRDYLNEFDFIWDAFSKESVLKGSFDKFVLGTANKKGTATVDKDFLQSLDSWRTYLATSISLNNKDLDEDEINFAVQQTIDRIIFLRIAEGRKVEPYGNLQTAIKQGEYYKNLFSIFKEADDKYNSGLFDFKKDKISKNLTIDNKVIKKIVNELYYPESQYEFSVLSVEILGSAYEQFLGKVIRITPAHHAKIEEKPEVRKAGGVYYTPQYIVEYIVKNTVGKLIDSPFEGGRGMSPKEISTIKIVDPACGSGSFLIGAYQYLLDWHKNYYSDNGKLSKGKKNSLLTPEGNLTTAEKKRILLNNIFGVDIDVNAVEVTKLSLLLKCMEGETQASISHQIKMFNERVLPTLDSNIKDGNSLIDTDIYSNQLDFGEEKKIKPFNWQKAFPDVFEQGGFDVIIGNPPYVDNRGFNKNQLEYFYANYSSFTSAGTTSFRTRKFNTFVAFIEVSKKILNNIGICGYIIHKNLLKTTTYRGIRKFLLENYSINKIADWGPGQFENVVAETISIFFSKKIITRNTIQIDFFKKNKKINTNKIEQSVYENTYDNIFNINLSPDIIHLISKIENGKSKLVDWVNINNGLVTGNDNKFISKTKLSNKYKTCVTGKNIKRYYIPDVKGFILYDSEKLMRARNQKIFEAKEKLIMQMINIKLVVAYDNRQLYNLGTTYSITRKNDEVSLKYILSLLNSNLLNFYYLKKYTNESTLTNAISTKNLFEFPIPEIDNEIKPLFNEIIKNVDLLFKLNEERAETKLQTKTSQIESKIDYCEDKINEIVYQLYGLTVEEIKIVEGK